MNHLEFKAALTVSDAGEITGLAWPFGSADRVGDMIEKGAFAFAGKVPMLFGHDQAQAVGVWDTITETAEGLQVKGRLLVDDVARAREVRALVREGAATGLSIGFVTKSAKGRAGGGRTIAALDLHEISIVPIPCHPGAKITSIKELNSMENEETTPELETRMSALETNLASITDTIGKVEKTATDLATKMARPVAANDNRFAANDNAPLERKAALETELRQTFLERKALTIATPGTAGNLVQDELSTVILEKLKEVSPVRGLANVVSVSTGLLQIPRLVNRVTPGSVTEIADKPESEPSFEQIDIKNFAMGVQVPVSRTALEDSAVNLTDYIANHIGSEFNILESEWFVTGNGTTQAEGVLTSTDVEAIEAEAIDTDALLDLFYAVKSSYALNGSWLMNRKTMRVVRGLRDADGNLLWQAGLQAGQPGLLLGKPVYESDFMPDVANDNTPILFGDFKRGYMITDRVTFEPHADYNTRWGEDIVVFGGRRRVGGKVVMGEALAKLQIAA